MLGSLRGSRPQKSWPAKAGTLERRQAAKVRAKEWPQEEEPEEQLFTSILFFPDPWLCAMHYVSADDKTKS